MKKRLLSILLCLVMVVGFVPLSTFSESAGTSDHIHCVCGKSDCDGGTGHDKTAEWIGIDDVFDITTSGNYYLTKDVKLSGQWLLPIDKATDINLCLNGKTISWSGSQSVHNYAIFIMNDSVSLTITDCQKYVGKITRTNASDGTIIFNGGTLTLFNGDISGNNTGEGVFNHNIFNMYGGTIQNNTSTGKYYSTGGGVVNDGTFNMTGGTITGNVGESCGGVFNRGTFNMSGGSITDNSGKESSGGVYNIDTLNLSGTPVITDNTVDGVKNNVYLRSDGKKVTVVDDGLSAGASVGLTGTLDKTIVTGTTSTTGFFCDNADYDLVSDGEGGLKLGTHNDHRICGDSECGDDKHGTDLTFKGISALREIDKNGNYYLKNDVVLDDDMWVCRYNVNLCLNGKSIVGGTYKSTLGINYNKSLTITDCQETPGKITHKEGKSGSGIENYAGATLTLWNGEISGNTGSGVYNKEGTFNMYGGSITGNTTGAEGGGVLNTEGGTFNMYGGSITDNSATSSYGGGVQNSSGRFNMYGGTISGNKAYNFGGGVYNGSIFKMYGGTISGNTAQSGGGGVRNGRTFTMSGGTISDNTAKSGGGVSNDVNGTFNLTGGSITGNTITAASSYGAGVYNDGTFTMSDGSITGNTADNTSTYGGGVYNAFKGTFNLNGGSITGNKSKGYAGGVYNCNIFSITDGIISGNSGRYGGGVFNWKALTMTGGSITNNIATGLFDACGGGISNHSNGTISMSGTPTVTGNNKGGRMASDGTITGGTTENVYLIGTKTITVTDKISKDASVGISGNLGNTVVTGTSDTTGFFSDETDYLLKPDDNGGLKLVRDSSISGKLLVKADGNEMTDGKKIYDTNAVVFDGATVKVGSSTVDGATYTYIWQKKGENGTYAAITELTDSTGPSDAGDYTLTVTATKNNDELASATWNFTIEKAALTATFVAEDKEYDGDTAVDDYKSLNVTGVAGNDELRFGLRDVAFADANVGEDITVTAKFSVEGDKADNYNVPETIQTKANITPKPLTVNITAQNKEYDGTAAATIEARLDLSGVVNNDEVTLVTSGVTAAFDTKDFGTNKTVTLSGSYEFSGAAARNYTPVIKPESLTANIDQKELTVENLAVENKFYDGLDSAVISGTPTLIGVVNGEDVKLINGTPSFTAITTGENIPVSFTDFSLSGADAGNYILTQPTGITADINPYCSDKSEYTVNSNDWLNTDFIITAKDGWLLSSTNTAAGEWVNTLTASQETDNGTLQFYVRNKESGVISAVITESYKIDKTAPTGEIRIDDLNVWQKFVRAISFNRFFNYEQTVTLKASDETSGSGLKTIEYLLTADDLDVDQLAEKTFTAYKNPFGINPDQKLIIYAKLTDTAGNVSYLRSDGIVLDATAPVINGADNNKTYCSADTLTITDDYLDTVTLDDETVTLTNGKLTLEPSADKQKVVATDKAGNSTTITVTINNGHTWSDWSSNGDNTHTRTCNVDGNHTETKDCHGGKATCQVKAICDDCHNSYGDFGAHDWDLTAWGYRDENGHAHTCKTDNCTAHSTLIDHIKDRDAATEDDPVKCAECDYKIADALGHICANHLTLIEANKATCTETGNIAYYECSCGKFYEDATANVEITDHDSVILGILNHDWAAATCTEPKTCKRDGCNATEGNPLGHNYSADWSKDETNHWHACQNDGCTDKADLARHIPGAAATETENQTCTECGYVITSALGHICANHLTSIEAKDATCTEDGNIAYYECSCGKFYKDATASVEITDHDSVILSKLGHDWAAATCTEPKTCKREGCNATEGDPLGHNYSADWSKDASGHWHACLNDGCTDKADLARHIPGAAATETENQTCTECGYVITPSLGHICANHLTPVKAKDATCTEDGNIAYYECSCGKFYKDATASILITPEQTVIKATGHDYEWKNDEEATATENGSKHEECKDCHDKKAAVEIPATGEAGSKTNETNSKTNEPTPKTGDNGMIGLWIALLFVSGAGVAGTTVYLKKRRVK